MKKYNIKIKKVFFLSFIVIVFCLPVGKVLAATVCWNDKEEWKKGECEMGDCSEGSEPIIGSHCYENTFQTTCCYDPNFPPAGENVQGRTTCGDGEDGTGICQAIGLSCDPPGSMEIVDAGDSCSFYQKCCEVYVPSPAPSTTSLSGLTSNPTNNSSGGGTNANNNSGSSSSGTAAITALPSQCAVGQSDGEAQGLCDTSDASNAKVLEQCKVFYPGTSACYTMKSYLNAMQKDCLEATATGQVVGTDCMAISKGEVYGREASKFASYLASKVPSGNDGNEGANNGAGGLDFDTIAQMGLPDSPGVKSILVNVVKWMLEIIGLITLIAFIISGGQYLMSAGDDTAMQTAKKNMTYSVIGIIVALSGFVIIRAIDTALRAVPGKMF